jgi:K+-sensing histidine kinase KdpD
VVSIYNDITEKKEYTDALEKQNKILGEISWIQSHVVRAPLARLMGLFDLLKTRDFKMVNEDELYRLIEQSMEELDKHIKDISQKAYLVNYLSSNRKYGSTGSPAS